MFPHKTLSKAEWHGKRDRYAKAVGGFAVARFESRYDYFPYGQPPHICEAGQIRLVGEVVSVWRWTGYRWREISSD